MPGMRHTTFRFCLDPTLEQAGALSRHAGAARFGFNTCLRLVKTAVAAKQADDSVKVPWTGFDLINAINAWKRSEQAGRVIAVDDSGQAEVVATGLAWRTEVSAQVFEEAAVDLGKALTAFSDSRKGTRAGRRVGFPRLKKKGRTAESFRLRNKHPKHGKPCIRLGDNCLVRSVTLPGIGAVKVHDDTRKLRRMLATGRGKILFATVSRRGGRWFVSLNVEAADLHTDCQHGTDLPDRWVGGIAACMTWPSPPTTPAPKSPASLTRNISGPRWPASESWHELSLARRRDHPTADEPQPDSASIT